MPRCSLWVMIRGKKKASYKLALIELFDVYNMYLAFRACFQAARTDVLANLASVLIKSSPLNIRLKLALGLFLRKTYIVARHRSFAAHLTFSHNSTLS